MICIYYSSLISKVWKTFYPIACFFPHFLLYFHQKFNTFKQECSFQEKDERILIIRLNFNWAKLFFYTLILKALCNFSLKLQLSRFWNYPKVTQVKLTLTSTAFSWWSMACFLSFSARSSRPSPSMSQLSLSLKPNLWKAIQNLIWKKVFVVTRRYTNIYQTCHTNLFQLQSFAFLPQIRQCLEAIEPQSPFLMMTLHPEDCGAHWEATSIWTGSDKTLPPIPCHLYKKKDFFIVKEQKLCVLMSVGNLHFDYFFFTICKQSNQYRHNHNMLETWFILSPIINCLHHRQTCKTNIL